MDPEGDYLPLLQMQVKRILTCYLGLADRTVQELLITQTSFTAAEEDLRSFSILLTFTPGGQNIGVFCLFPELTNK